MAASRETEIKLQVAHLGTIRRQLMALGFRVVEGRRFESNRLFYFHDQRLRKNHCALRLRFVNKECLLTFKGPPIKSQRHKVREEAETLLDNGEAAQAVLDGLGLNETFRYDKFRTTFARRRDLKGEHRPVAELDETPIGNYLELEGPPVWIDSVARELGRSPADYITASYAALYFEACRRARKRPGNMVFERKR